MTTTLILPVDDLMFELHQTITSDSYDHTCRAILAYHEVLPDPSPYLYRITDAQFEEHLSFFANFHQAGHVRPLFSFDDGHRSNFEHALPLLHKYGLRATFFILAGLVGKDSNYMSWSQVREIAATGHDVQSHGWSHRLLSQCSADQLKVELDHSKEELENRLGCAVGAISVPGGRYNQRVLESCANAGYRFVFHSNPWIPLRTTMGIHLVGRLIITAAMSGRTIQNHLAVSGLKRLCKLTAYSAKETLRCIVGERIYHQLWCHLVRSDPQYGVDVQVH